MKIDHQYKAWINLLKNKIRSAQIKAAVSVNAQLIALYWDLGKMIIEKQEQNKWGSGLIAQIAKDLKKELPETSGFSRTNLYSMRQFYLFYRHENIHQVGGQIQSDSIIRQPGGQLENIPDLLLHTPWRHHVLIMNKCNSQNQALFYIQKTIENNWSRDILQMQIESMLFERQGKAITNFETTLPKPQSDLAKETLKNPFIFDFLTLEENIQELELERRLTENITQFLLELGKGFAFIGRQYPLQVGGKERKIDLSFLSYSYALLCSD